MIDKIDRTQQQCSSSPSGLWQPSNFPSLLCIAAAVVINTMHIQLTMQLWASNTASCASHGLTQVKRQPASQRTAAWKLGVVARRRCGEDDTKSKSRERHVWRGLELEPMGPRRCRVGEGCPGMCPRGGPSGFGHLRSLRVAPSGTTSKTFGRGSNPKPR